MKFGRFFIDRPRFAAVISILIVVVGMISYFQLPVTQYPEIAPPTIVVRAQYPGAPPEVIADTVATPIEQEVNGVEGMLYMTSSSTADGAMQLTITFELGTDLDAAQVLVQNRVAVAEARLPEEVRRLGVVTEKSSPDLMMVVHLISPDSTYDQLYISNYALLRVRDVLSRIPGVGSITVFGVREYSMRVWLDPDRLASLNLTAGDVLAALRAQNVQVAGGILGQPPMPAPNAFQFTVNTQGRFSSAEEFGQIIVKSAPGGRLTRVNDVARIELGARSYSSNSFLDGQPALGMGIFQRPGSNALETASAVFETMDELERDFPAGLEYRVVYNPTQFVQESVFEVYKTIAEAVLLVVLVIILFLQSWRAAIIPIVAIPVSLIGTFLIMQALGFSLNNLTLFGLVLAIGIVVDDAIVVVENIERVIEDGKDPREAAKITMDEVGTAVVSIALVLSSVFVPAAFVGGISGQFFQQFAVTIAVATIISALNSLTLSPALGAILLRPKGQQESGFFGRAWDTILGPVFRGFDAGFDRVRDGYRRGVGGVARRPLIGVAVFVVLLAATAWGFNRVPTGFIPPQDQGYLITAIELPKGASLERTTDVVLRASEIARQVPGVAHAVGIAGFSGATFSAASNAGVVFVPLEPFDERGPEESAQAIFGNLFGAMQQIQEAQIFVVQPPPVRGLGRSGGFTMMVQDISGRGLDALQAATRDLAGAANQSGEVTQVFTTFGTGTPRYYVDIDRTKAEMLSVPVASVLETLQVYIGSAYVNDFNLFGRTYQVTTQADAPYRLDPVDIRRLRARSTTGAMVPLGSVAEIRIETGPDRVVHHNLYPSAELQGSAARGRSTGQALSTMERLASDGLPQGMGYSWVDIAFQEKQAGNVGLLIFPLSVLFVFLLLTAQYESWSLPLAVILIVPLCLSFALLGVALRGMDNNILTQIGFIVLIGLASKNAILIVEFARQREEAGLDRVEAAIEAAELRLRPILMTSFAFILGVVPLVIASGAGAEMRQALGTAVFSGMIGVTLFGLFLTPAFYVIIRRFASDDRAPDGETAGDNP